MYSIARGSGKSWRVASEYTPEILVEVKNGVGFGRSKFRAYLEFSGTPRTFITLRHELDLCDLRLKTLVCGILKGKDTFYFNMA
jgi:hypothetical protein